MKSWNYHRRTEDCSGWEMEDDDNEIENDKIQRE
jgi:hypothetical protein